VLTVIKEIYKCRAVQMYWYIAAVSIPKQRAMRRYRLVDVAIVYATIIVKKRILIPLNYTL
jgi:hypothetical protein